eukprot:1979931-Rhodomonas_salina.7
MPKRGFSAASECEGSGSCARTWRAMTQAPVLGLHTRAEPSSDPETTSFPSALNFPHVTAPLQLDASQPRASRACLPVPARTCGRSAPTCSRRSPHSTSRSTCRCSLEQSSARVSQPLASLGTGRWETTQLTCKQHVALAVPRDPGDVLRRA